MYQSTRSNPLSPPGSSVPQGTLDALWRLFLAIGTQWELTDDPAPYRGRLREFTSNRMSLNPFYLGYYQLAGRQIDALVASVGEEQAYAQLFTAVPIPPAVPETASEFISQYVVGELIALRLALGGFKVWGARNYCGYMGGENVPGRPAPYRTATLP